MAFCQHPRRRLTWVENELAGNVGERKEEKREKGQNKGGIGESVEGGGRKWEPWGIRVGLGG